jgi:hypothetical protein
MVLVQEQLSRVWPIALLAHPEMKHAGRRNAIKNGRKKIKAMAKQTM